MNEPHIKMVKHIVFLLASLVLIRCSRETEDKLTIAVSANMQFAMEEVVLSFKKKTHIPCDIVVSSSGKLATQIVQGAPFDVFVSADMEYPQHIFEAGKSIDKPKVYAFGKLILWSISEKEKISLSYLKDKKCQHIALANPETAPYGKAAIEVLKKLNLYDTCKSKFVFGESISQTNQFIQSKSAQVGFTAMSVVKAKVLNDAGSWIEIPDSLYTPIRQGAIQLNSTKNAQLFYQFLFADQAKAIFLKYGYKLP
jgi:molybdate transport system substrate-binding protein